MRETVVNMEDRALERVSSEVQLGTLQASTPQSLVNGASEMARVPWLSHRGEEAGHPNQRQEACPC